MYKTSFYPSLNVCFLTPAKGTLRRYLDGYSPGDSRDLKLTGLTTCVLRVLTRVFIKGFIILGLLLGLTNCSMLGIHDQSFECPPEEGMKCTSVSKVNNAIDQAFDSTNTRDNTMNNLLGESCKNCSNQDWLTPAKSPSSITNLESIPQSIETTGHKDQPMRIWIAPRLVEGVMMESIISGVFGTTSSLKGDF